jgi:hypothetical protein
MATPEKTWTVAETGDRRLSTSSTEKREQVAEHYTELAVSAYLFVVRRSWLRWNRSLPGLHSVPALQRRGLSALRNTHRVFRSGDLRKLPEEPAGIPYSIRRVSLRRTYPSSDTFT